MLSDELVKWIEARPQVLQQVHSVISVGRTADYVGEAVRHELLGLYCDEIDIPNLRGVDWAQVGGRFALKCDEKVFESVSTTPQSYCGSSAFTRTDTGNE